MIIFIFLVFVSTSGANEDALLERFVIFGYEKNNNYRYYLLAINDINQNQMATQNLNERQLRPPSSFRNSDTSTSFIVYPALSMVSRAFG